MFELAHLVDSAVAVSIGIGMAAACGFRVFVPMVVIGIASRVGVIPVSSGFEWISTWPAIAAFGIATALEIGAYYFPWLDNALDSASVPAAAIAGVVVTAACVVDLPPLLKWSLAIVAGGGAAATVKTGMAGLRLGSTATTGGVGNPLVSTVEWIASLALSLMSVFVPVLASLVAVLLVVLLVRFSYRLGMRFLARPTDRADA